MGSPDKRLNAALEPLGSTSSFSLSEGFFQIKAQCSRSNAYRKKMFSPVLSFFLRSEHPIECVDWHKQKCLLIAQF